MSTFFIAEARADDHYGVYISMSSIANCGAWNVFVQNRYPSDYPDDHRFGDSMRRSAPSLCRSFPSFDEASAYVRLCLSRYGTMTARICTQSNGEIITIATSSVFDDLVTRYVSVINAN
jgi:hypothetical protein